MSADEDENEKVIREKTDGGLTLLGEGVRQDEGAAPVHTSGGWHSHHREGHSIEAA